MTPLSVSSVQPTEHRASPGNARTTLARTIGEVEELRGTFFGVATGFNPQFGHLRVGHCVDMQIMDRLCRDDDVRAYDYGGGDADYKREFGDRCLQQAEVLLFGPSMHAAGLNATRTARIAAARLAGGGSGTPSSAGP